MRSGDAKVCPQCGEIKPHSEFRDKSLVTGIGKMCIQCKSGSDSQEDIKTNQSGHKKSKLSQSDINKLFSFSKNPLKYALGTTKSKEKVEYLENIKSKFNAGQLKTYSRARKQYDAALSRKVGSKNKKGDFYTDLGQALNNHQSAKIRYKGTWRTIDPYALNKTYCVAYCHLKQDIRTFRIDRIQSVQLSANFNYDKSLQDIAQQKLREAPNYRSY